MRGWRWMAAIMGSCTLSVASAVALHGEQALATDTQPGTPIEMTVEEAVARARAASLRQVQLRSLQTAAEAETRVARARRLPSLEASAGYTRFSDVPEYAIATPSGQRQVLYPNLPDAFRVRVGTGLALYTGGRLSGLVAAADADAVAAAMDVATGEASLLLETRTAYLRLVTATEMGRVLDEALRAYEAHLRDARNYEAVGMAARNEVLAVQAEQERARLDLVRARNAVAIAQADLGRLLDLPVGALVAPIEPLEGTAALDEQTEDLVSMALAGRSECRALQSRLDAARALVGVERAARLPQVSLTAGWNYQNPNRSYFPPEADWKDSWDVGVAAQVSIFDGGKASAATKRARARVAALEAQIDDVRRRIRLEVTQRRLELEAARIAVSVAETGLDAAREGQQVAADRYKEGLIPSSELLDAEVAHLRAGLSRAEALAQVRLATAGLDRAVGR